jgi:Rhs element Vgr protein
MSASTKIKSGGVVTFTVKVGGNAVPDGVRVLSVEIEKRVNRIPMATITILDGDPATGKFDASSSATFVPGSDVTVEAGYDSNNQLIFKGIITKQSIRIEEAIGSVLEVECRDAAVKMIVGRKSLTYSKQKDSDVISSIIGNYSGLSASVTATSSVWPEQVQYYATDWDFVLSRADANGFIVTALNGKVSVFDPGSNTSSALTISYGDNLLSFSASLDSVTQLGSITATTWDYANQAISSATASSSIKGPGNLSTQTLSGVIGLPDYQLQTTAPLLNADLTTWSKAQMVKSEYSKIQGRVKFQGTSLVDPGKYITLQGLGDRFNGDHLISGVLHTIADGNWFTEVSIGLSPVWFTEEPDVMSPPASGLLPAARGLYNATVKQMYQDTDSQYRILVTVPLFDMNGQGIWARLTNFYSTNGAGAFFLPEPGDEVVLGFLNEDPRYPVILGSMYSSSKIKPFTGLDPNEKNSIKAIVSKSGIYVQFDDKNKIFTIATPQKNTVILSDKDKQITIQDQNSNSIVMSSDGITIKSPKSINIEAGQNINIKGTQGITIQSSGGDVQVSGMNIKENADMQYTVQGGQMAKISSGVEMQLQSTMIMIN